LGESVDLLTPATGAAKLLSTMSLDFFDVTANYSRSLRISILGKGVKEASSSIDAGMGVRAFMNKGRGTAFSQSLDHEDIETIVRRAVGFAKAAQPDPYFKEMPGPSTASEVPSLCDDQVVNLTLEDLGVLCEDLIGAAHDVRKGASYEGGMSASHSKTCLVTSTGVSVEFERTGVGVALVPTYKEGDDIGSSYEFEYGVSLAEVDFPEVGRKAAEKALEQFGTKRVESGELPMVLMPDASTTLFSGLLVAASGERAVKGRSYLSGMLEKRIAPEILEIDDDGTLPGAISSSTYDGEGVPTRPTKVISKGTLLTFIHDSYSAGIAGVQTTGHAHRAGYGVTVAAGPTNIRVKPGDASMDEITEDIDRGILVTSASLFPNMVSGEYSSTIDEGFLVESGEKKHPVKNLMVGGHVLELLNGIELVSREGRTYGKGHFSPAVKIAGLRFAGD